MSELNETQRAHLSTKKFGLPERARTAKAKKRTGNYPIPDKGHAISAKSRAKRQYKLGNLTKAQFERIKRKADRMLRKDS